jgi:hypothetical protein
MIFIDNEPQRRRGHGERKERIVVWDFWMFFNLEAPKVF